MAQGVTADLNVVAYLKEYYGEQVVEALVLRNSPVLAMIKNDRIGGKYIPLPMAVFGSGAVTSDYQQVTQQASNSYNGVAMQVTPGRLFSSFVLDPMEWLASDGDKKAFISVLAIKAMLAMDDLRKVLATTFYRSGFLEMGPVLAIDGTNRLFIDVDASTAMAISPQSNIMFAATTTSAYRNANAVVVSSIQTVQSGATAGAMRITFASAYDASVAVNDQVMLKGGRDVNNLPNAFTGLAGWLPTVANRTGGTWTTFIGTSFFGVNRSVAPDRLAGQYVLKQAGEAYTQALLRCVKAVRRGGGVPMVIVVNDDDYGIIAQEALANRTFFQNITGSGKNDKTNAVQGINQFTMTFSTSWIDKVYDDPYCPRNFAYILDIEALRFVAITNSTEVFGGFESNNEPGAPKATDGKEPTTQFVFLQDDFYTTTPIDLQSGKGLRVDYQLFGNWIVTAPAHCGVVQFA